MNLNIGNGPAINSNVYAYINSSLRPYPSYIWNWIHAEVGQRGNNGPDLARRIKQGLTQNLLISRETKRDEIDSGNPSWVGWESFAGYRTSDNFRLREGLKWSEEFPGKPTILIIDEFLNQVEEGIKAAGEILEVALEAGFSTVLQLVGFNPKEFFETIKHLGDILQQIAPAILNNYDEFGTNFVEGLNLGFKEFFKNFPDNVVGLALKWLLGTDLEGIKIPAKVNAKTLFSFALDPTFREFVLRFLGDYLEG